MGCVNSTEVKDISSVNGDYKNPAAAIVTETELKPSPVTFVPSSTSHPSSLPSQVESQTEAEGKNLDIESLSFTFLSFLSGISLSISALIIP